MAKKDAKIIALSERDHLIARMGLVFGRETGDEAHPFSSQKTVAIREVFDNHLDILERVGGGYMRVRFNEDGSIETQDSGTGIPVNKTTTPDGEPCTSLFLAMGTTRSSSNFETDIDRFSRGTNGMGQASTVALSEKAIFKIYRDNKIYELHFKDGIAGFFDEKDGSFREAKDKTELKVSKDNRPAKEKKKFKTGTYCYTKLNDSVFGSSYPIDVDDLIDRLKGTAFLRPQITIEITNELREIEGEPQEEVFHFEDGLKNLVALPQVKEQLTDTLVFKGEGSYIEENLSTVSESGEVENKEIEKRIPFEVAFAYENGYDYHVASFVNTIKTRLGGVHETAFEKAIVKSFNKRFRSMRGMLYKKDPDPTFEDYKEGLSVVISVFISDPQFTSQTKEELGGKTAGKEFQKALEDSFDKWLSQSKNQDEAKKIGDKVISAMKARVKAKEQRDLKRKKRALERSTVMPTKLVDCEITHAPESELYICEGDSALGSVKSARDSKTQALLPIRGKIINAHKETTKKVLNNREVQDIIKCLDAGVGESFNLEDARYQRIFIAADADVDGGSIATLLYALFWHLFREVIEEGRLYQINTPLFIIKDGTTRYYASDDYEKEKILKKLNKKKKKPTILRAKGLGELDKAVLNETGMNPKTRTVTQITLKDAEKAAKMLDTVLGKNVKIRREWIENNPMVIFCNDFSL